MNAEEELFNSHEHLAKVTVHKMFKNPSKLAESLHLQTEDFYQYARIGLLEACKSYEKNPIGSFKNYAIRNMRWAVGKLMDREAMNQSIYKNTHYKKRNVNRKIKLLSMSMNPYGDIDDDSTFYDIVSTDNFGQLPESVESIVHSEIAYHQMLNVLTDNEREIVFMKMKQWTYQEIAEVYGISRQAIGFKVKRIQEKINRHRGVANV